MEKSTLGSSWAEVAQPHSENAATVPKNEQQTNKINHDPNAWAENKQHATYAEVVEHEEQQSQEFPTPQESLKQTNTEPLPASGGVGDLLNDSAETTTSKDSIQPPNPNRSFADVASNKDFPKPQHDMNNQINQDQPPLSDIPDVNDMLQQPSVHVPPVPPSQSFAKVAAKEIPPENQPLSDRTQELIKNQLQEKEDSLAINDDNFPTLAQSNLMAEEKADKEEKAMYSEISRFNQVGEEEDIYKESNVDSQLKKSFADVTGSNLENAPPPAVSHVDQHPVYDEETVYLERAKQDERKHLQNEQGNNEQLIEEEKLKQVEPTKEQKEQEEKENKVYEKSKEIVKEDKKENENSIVIRLEAFDKHHTGRITIFQTMYALYTLGYSWFCIIPGAILMHLRLSPMTSPYHFPFIYRSPFDLILLPIYTKKLQTALTYNTPIVHQNKEQVDKIVKIYGHQRGLGYWDGIRALRYMEKDTLRWWQVGLWAIHRIQWTLIYTMLHEPESSVVTEPTLLSLVSKN
ncbi:uncharacterized protein BX663DRAFT_526337 [Cokeromyces recurvatus]|uniref:uncharacterized protein n=1 Tax=Cokeromyces recurvatus TaxID=90255 RepID=UPI00221E7D12|nr:uncharacterized protein BX663DRAFT_526337 [Cokeromyces recurvatus]KAI7898018.1 hypothetical protein BX663DRAFT_526337 [Cokeromyces recurvatus]